MNPATVDPERKPVLAVVGSSAGGLEALRGLLAPLPANCGLSFIVAHHTSPGHVSMLRDLLARETRLVVEDAVDQGPLRPSHVYVTPPDSDAIVEGEVLRLRAHGVRGPKPLVDRLFQSAAAAFGPRCVAIVLSGTGSDGAEGVRAVKSAGGRVFIQEPKSAKEAGMPEAARATGCADAVLTLEALAKRVAGLGVPEGPESLNGLEEADELERILSVVLAATEVDLRLYKHKTILRRVTQRARSVGAGTLTAYRDLLEKDPEEIQRLMRNTVRSVTSFARDEGPFDALGDAIARQFQDGTGPLRAWVPACATGEEAYTLAILFEQYIPHRRVQVFATDLDEGAITPARRAIYAEEKVRQLPPDIVKRTFRNVGRGFQVEKAVRERVIFARHDVLRDPPFLSLDLISCRNLLLHLRACAREEVLHRFHQALKPGGVLLLGKSEHARGSMFQAVDRRNKVYVNRDLNSRLRRQALSDGWDAVRAERPAGGAGASSSVAQFQRKLLEAFAPAAVLTDGAFQVRETWGSIERYLTPKTGGREMTLLALAPKALAASLRAQIYRCRRTGRPAEGLRCPFEIQGKRVSLQTLVYPAGELDGEALFAVAFVETQEPPVGGYPALSGPTMEQVREMEAELSATRQNLQSLVEELESTNEELRASNDELRSTNAELAALNEELVHEDISGHKRVEERMLYVAEHDDLTGLWNRKSFQERLDTALRRNSDASKVGLVFLDLDRFKDTNDTLGHLAGDQVLLEIARRLKQTTAADSLARFGGDEFVVVLENMRDRDQIRTVVERLLHGFERPIEAGGRNLFISASIGVTVYPDDATTPEVMLRNADLAMYRAKAEGRRGYRFFDKRIEAEINDRVEIERELNRGIGTRDLWVAFQPQWDLRTGEVIGAEALLRASSPRLKGISIGRIVSIAEESGLILAIGQSVMREAVCQLARWRSKGMGLQLAVNLSAVQFHQQDVFALITESLRARSLPMSALKVEITETVLLNRSVRVRETLHALHGAGIGLVLDDFGTGYSSLSYLREFPIQAVKIDRAFLKGIGKKSNDEAIVKGIIQLAHSMGLGVIAEGVETEEQAAFLRAQDCDSAQGFLFSQALQASDLDKLLLRNSGERPAEVQG